MMKKIYQIPETYIFEKMVVASPLAASTFEENSTRKAEGAPTTEKGLPSGIGETSQTEDPFSDSEGNDKGQGGGGGTTRAKQWTGDWELPNWE